jgi:hypothetical protein
MLRLACDSMPRHAFPSQTEPDPASPCLRCPAAPSHTQPGLTLPYLRFHAMPEGNHAALANSLPAWLKA